MMRPHHHKLLTLLYRIHYLRQYLLRRSVIIYLQRLFDRNRKRHPPLLELHSRLIESPPESADHDGDDDGLFLLDDERGTLTARRKGLGRALRESDHPTALQCPGDLTRIRRIQPLP